MGLLSGTKFIAQGMGTTAKHFFKKRVTVQYPKQMRNFHPRFRGAVAMVRDQETGKERCVGCGLCSAVCPANCLTVVPGTDEHGIRNAKIYLYDMSRCVFCGMCVEVCPELALVMTHEFELSVRDRSELVLDAEAMLRLADREKERTGEAIEEPGFPAISDAPSTFAKHNELDPRIQRGNFQSHQPLLGELPHGLPMKYEEFLRREKEGKPQAPGTLPPQLKEIQNKHLPEAEQTPMPKVAEDLKQDQANQVRVKLLTVADVAKIQKHAYYDEDGLGDLRKTDVGKGIWQDLEKKKS
jgi:NADH-quinone oxidoreductase subunit I